MTHPWQPFREPLQGTLLRTGLIAIAVGAVVSHWMGGLSFWPRAALLALWPSFGGHLVEVWFLNWLRPRLPAERTVQVIARLAVWFVGGAALAIGVTFTASVLLGVVAVRRSPGGSEAQRSSASSYWFTS